MSEVVNVFVAFAVIIFIFRWATSGSEPSERDRQAETLGFRPKNVTSDMIDTVHGMFPDVPTDNIRYDLLRTGSVEQTTEKILSRGFLEAPPAAYYTVYPRDGSNDRAASTGGSANGQQRAGNAGTSSRGQSSGNAVAGSSKPKETLISRFGLQDRVASGVELKDVSAPEEMGGKAVWEDSAEKRESSLRERKAKMVLAARQRMLAQQQQAS